MARRITHPNSFPEIILGIADLIVDAAPLSRTLQFRGAQKAMASRRAAIYHYRTSVRHFLSRNHGDPMNAVLAERLRPQLAALELVSMEIRPIPNSDNDEVMLFIMFPGSPESRYADELSQIQQLREQLQAEANAAFDFEEEEELAPLPSETPSELAEEPAEGSHQDNVEQFFSAPPEEAPRIAPRKASLLTEAEQKHINNVMSQLGIKKER